MPRIGLLSFLLAVLVSALPAYTDDADATFDLLLVSGEVPGPGVWTLRKGDHTRWILGTLQPLPKKIKWRSKQVESLIAQSQEVVTAGRNASRCCDRRVTESKNWQADR